MIVIGRIERFFPGSETRALYGRRDVRRYITGGDFKMRLVLNPRSERSPLVGRMPGATAVRQGKCLLGLPACAVPRRASQFIYKPFTRI